jgi:hypothetical protein
MSAGEVVMHLTTHFTLEELTFSATAQRLHLDNTPSEDIAANLARVAGLLERIRERLGGHEIIVTSGYRCPALNDAIHGAQHSAHEAGLAADFVVPAFGPPAKVCEALRPHLLEFGIDQLIEEWSSWTHVGLAPDSGMARAQALVIDAGGTRFA